MTAGEQSTCADKAEMERALRLLFPGNGPIEMRALYAGRSATRGFYDNGALLIDDAAMAADSAKGVYVTLNALRSTLQAQVDNSLTAGPATADTDIASRELFLIDIDADREPSDSNTTNEEHAAAIDLARDVRYCLHEEGWPEPLLGDSGNGAHLIYRLPSLPNDNASRDLIAAALKELNARHGHNGLKVDESVFNASRISKLYGTMTRKGPHSEHRPQRMARIIEEPETLEPVSVELLKSLAGAYIPEEPDPSPARPQRHTPGTSGFTMDEFIARHNISTQPKRAYRDGFRWQMDCPFNSNHKAPDAALYETGGGALGFKCSHNSCSDKRWVDFRAVYEPRRPTDWDSRRVYKTAPGDHGSTPLTGPGWSIADIPDLSSMSEQKLEYAVEGLILKSAITLVTGEPASGKSTWLTSMAEAISLGRSFCGLQTRKSPVLIMDRENSIPVVQDRMKRVNVRTNSNLRYWGSWVEPRPVDLNHSTLQDYVASCDEKPVIIIDSFNAFHFGAENDAQDTRDYLKPVRDLANSGAAVIMIHHVGKSETSKKYRGSSAILGEIDAGLLIENKSDEPGLGVISVVPFKSRVLGLGVPTFRYVHGAGFEAVGQSPARGSFVMSDDVNTIRGILIDNPGIGTNEIKSLAQIRGGISKQRVSQIIRDLDASKLVRTEVGLRGKIQHYWHAAAVITQDLETGELHRAA